MILPAKPENAIFHFSLSKFRKFATRYSRFSQTAPGFVVEIPEIRGELQ